MGVMETIRFRILPYWKTFVVILLPLVLLPLPLIAQTQEAKAGYAIIIMAVFWMTEALPLPVTSLLPVVLFPLLGILSTGRVCPNYMKETNMMFLGGIIVALAVENCNLHKRIALRVMMLVGAKPKWLMLGIMLTTAFLSMWISNTATTALMVPIVEAVTQELFKDNTADDVSEVDDVPMTKTSSDTSTMSLTRTVEMSSSVSLDTSNEGNDPRAGKRSKRQENLRTGFFLSLAYSANLGGTGTIVGSGTNLIVKGLVKQLYGSGTGLNFATWMAFNVPGMLINIFLAWIWLLFLFIGFNEKSKNDAKEKEVNQIIRNKYINLGPMSFQENVTLFLFSICVALWFFRDPQFLPGWNQFFPLAEVDDSTAVMGIVILLFVIPANPRFLFFRPALERGPEIPSPALLDWKYAQDRIPWGLFLLMGAGFALSDASKVSGLSLWLGQRLTQLEVLPPFAIMLIICIMTASITEVASNTATANILLPILAEMAEIMEINPLSLMLPAAVTCSYAFMLPVATPPNAIVFAAAKMRPADMIKAGFFMNIICVFVICTMMITYGNTMFDVYNLPSWAIKNATVAASLVNT